MPRLMLGILATVFGLVTLPFNTQATTNIPAGWEFKPHIKGRGLEAHSDQIGTLSEIAPHSQFLTVPVISRRAVGISERTGSAQLIRLESEVNAVMHREKSKPGYASKKIVGERGVFEAEYGTSGKGMTWVYASTIGDSVIVLVGVSREKKPAKTAREGFFKMARAFSP